jgi:hypothetical protein
MHLNKKCDFFSNTGQCECTPSCSALVIQNTCTGSNYDISSTNCVSEPTTVVSITTTTENVSTQQIEKAQGTTTSEKDIPASAKLGMDTDDLLWIVSGSVLFIYLAAGVAGCSCCLVLRKRRMSKKMEKKSHESFVSGKMASQNHFNGPSSLPSVFYRIDE